MAEEHVRLEIQEQIAMITLSRPEKMNAFSGKMAVELARAYEGGG